MDMSPGYDNSPEIGILIIMAIVTFVIGETGLSHGLAIGAACLVIIAALFGRSNQKPHR